MPDADAQLQAALAARYRIERELGRGGLATSYYGETGGVYLLWSRAALPYRLAWLAFIYLGAVGLLHLVRDIADTLNGPIALPNLASVPLSIPVPRQLHRELFAR